MRRRFPVQDETPVFQAMVRTRSSAALSYFFLCATFWNHVFSVGRRSIGPVRRGGRAVEGGGLENRRAKAPWVRILPPPPNTMRNHLPERWPSGRRRPPAKRMWGLKPHPGFESLPLRHILSFLPVVREKPFIRLQMSSSGAVGAISL